MARNLDGAVVVITGASSGIGREAARQFAQRGANVVLAARREDPLNDLVVECQRLGVKALAVPTDVADADAVEQLAHKAEERFGGIDVWVNNAGVYLAGRFEDTPPEDFQRLMDVNFNGVVYGSRAALPRLRRRHGVLINTASVDSATAFPYFTAYVASKWAVRGFTAALREENLNDGIDVCTIMPASIDTPLFQHAANYTGWKMKALSPTYSPDMVAEAIVGCAERPKREVIVGQAGRMMAWQWFFAPRLMERMALAQAKTDHFRMDQSAPRTPGNLHEPMQFGAETHGGWGGSRGPDRIINASVIGLAALVPVAALMASGRTRDWMGGLVGYGPRRPTGIQRFVQPLTRALHLS